MSWRLSSAHVMSLAPGSSQRWRPDADCYSMDECLDIFRESYDDELLDEVLQKELAGLRGVLEPLKPRHDAPLWRRQRPTRRTRPRT